MEQVEQTKIKEIGSERDQVNEDQVNQLNQDQVNQLDQANEVEEKSKIQTQIRFYRKKLPNPRDKVAFEFVKLEETLVRIKLVEYEDYPAMILVNELTRQKQIKSWTKLCPIGQLSVGEVLSIEDRQDGTYVYCSIKGMAKADQTKYMENYYYKSKRLCNFMKRIAINSKTDLVTTCEKLSWAMYDMIEASDSSSDPSSLEHPLDKIDHPDKIRTLMSKSSVNVNDVRVKESNQNKEQKREESPEFADLVTTSSTNTNATNDDPFGESNDDDVNANEDDEGGDKLKLTPEMANLLLASHEQFFGKLIMQKTIRAGIICYSIDGTQTIKDTLISLRDNILKEFPTVTLSFNLRDIPVYEFKLKCLDSECLEKAIAYLLQFLKTDKLLFRHISTK